MANKALKMLSQQSPVKEFWFLVSWMIGVGNLVSIVVLWFILGVGLVVIILGLGF